MAISPLGVPPPAALIDWVAVIFGFTFEYASVFEAVFPDWSVTVTETLPELIIVTYSYANPPGVAPLHAKVYGPELPFTTGNNQVVDPESQISLPCWVISTLKFAS